MRWIGGTCYNGTQFVLNLDNIAMIMPDSEKDYTQVVVSGGDSYYLNINYETLLKVIANILSNENKKEEEKENV